MKKRKGYIDRGETFDEFLAKDDLLAETETAALKEITTDQKKARSHERQQQGRLSETSPSSRA